MKTYKERFIIGLLIVVLAGVGYLFFHDNQKQKKRKETESEMNHLKIMQDYAQSDSDIKRLKDSLGWDEKKKNAHH